MDQAKGKRVRKSGDWIFSYNRFHVTVTMFDTGTMFSVKTFLLCFICCLLYFKSILYLFFLYFLGTSKWYDGTVTSLKSGRDGEMNAVYEIIYGSDDEEFEVDHLVEDYHQQSVRFTDI